MDSCFLNVFHDAANHRGCAVGNGIHIYFYGVPEKLIHQDGMARGNMDRLMNEGFQLFLFVNDFHSPATQNVGWPHQNRVANFGCRLEGFGSAGGNSIFRLSQPQFLYEGLETLPVLGLIDTVRGCTNDGSTSLCQRNGEVQRRLATELDDESVR